MAGTRQGEYQLSKKAMATSAKAYQYAQAAHDKARSLFNGTGKMAGAKSAKQAKDGGKRGKSK